MLRYNTGYTINIQSTRSKPYTTLHAVADSIETAIEVMIDFANGNSEYTYDEQDIFFTYDTFRLTYHSKGQDTDFVLIAKRILTVYQDKGK